MDFKDASNRGSLAATFNELELDGKGVGGQISFSENFNNANIRERSLGASNINDISYTGEHSFVTTGVPYTDRTIKPIGIVATLKGISSDGNGKFVAGFGATQTE